MDWAMIIIFVGLIFTGIIIGCPVAYYVGKRDAYRECGFAEPKPIRRARRNLEKKNVLFAEYLEVRDER